MRGKLGSTVVALVLLFSAGSASAQAYDWATCQPSGTLSACGGSVRSCCYINPTSTTAGTAASVIIAMDRCHQQYANNDAPVPGAPGSNNSQAWCVNPNTYNANGLFYAYGLVYRLMQNGIPVYWIINPTKAATGVTAYQSSDKQIFNPQEVDAWVLSNGANPPLSTSALTDCGTCTPPVKMIDKSTMTSYSSTWTYSKTQFPLKGGAFLIAAADRANFNKFMLHQSPYPAANATPGCGQSGNDCYNFADVSMYEVDTGAHFAWQNYLVAPVAGAYTKIDNQLPIGMKIDYKPPRVARLGSTNAVATNWLAAANLDQPATNATCGSTTFSPSTAVYCNVSEADMIANRLVTGGFGWAWIDKQSFSDCTNAMLKLNAFMTGVPGTWYAGHVMFNESGVQTVEECANMQVLGKPGTGTSSGTGLSIQNTAVTEDCKSSGSPDCQPFIIRYPQNLFVQWGDLPLIMASGSVTYWTTDSTHRWNPVYTGTSNSLHRLITQENVRVSGTNAICGDTDGDGFLGDNNSQDGSEIPHSTTSAACDYQTTPTDTSSDRIEVATYGRLDNNINNGVAFYTPGNNLSNKPAELRILLNSLIATPYGSSTVPATSTYEITRANPVTATVGGSTTVVQGTYDYQTPVSSPTYALVDEEVANFVFPYRTGHLKAVIVSSATNSTYAGVTSANLKFDAASNVPLSTNTLAGSCTFPKNSGNSNCRTIFTNSGTTRVMFTTANAATIRPVLKSDTSLSDASLDTLMGKIVGGNFGGVSRSTAAVIEASSVIANGRPKMAYVGAHDGMLHAICAEVNAAKGCDVLGRELWAFMPKTELPFVVRNLQRIDGSPRVMDVYDYFGATSKSWKTLLMFHTGIGDYSSADRVPAVYALDISDPTDPKIQWVYSEAPLTAQPAHAMGQGLTLAAGRVNYSAGVKNVVYVQTNNGGSGNAGVLVYALDTNDGTKLPTTKWATNPFYYDFTPNPHTSGNDALALSAIPGGAIPIDLTGTNYVTDVVFTTPFGGLWMLNAQTGASENGSGVPMMQTTADYYPMGAKPAVFEQTGTQYAVLVTGGYADPSDTTWPMRCKDTVGTNVCAQNRSSTLALPIQYTLSMKLVTTTSAPVGTTFPLAPPAAACGGSAAACSGTIFRFRKDLGQDERGFSQPLIVGDEIFFNTDTENVNREAYGTTGTNQGKFYGMNLAGTVNATQNGLAIINGASAVAQNAGNLYAGSGTKLKYEAAAASTNGTSVKITSAAGGQLSRKLWLRSE
ncbi:MAG TPA: hypothetical protein VL326_38350 [Kofleriaceae bacterium]|nr:hypothetical protein [Kofleriaceae bacterium]